MSSSAITDDLLLEEIKKGDEAAFICLYDRYWKKLFNYGFSKLGKKEVVEGFVQEVFLDFWVKRAEITIHSSVASYFFTAIKHKVLNYHKARIVRKKFALKEQVKGERNVTEVEEKVFYKDLKSNIKKVIASFPQQRKTVYKLRFKEGLSYQEIADSMTISISTVEKHMIRALKDLRIHLKNHDYTISILIVSQINF